MQFYTRSHTHKHTLFTRNRGLREYLPQSTSSPPHPLGIALARTIPSSFSLVAVQVLRGRERERENKSARATATALVSSSFVRNPANHGAHSKLYNINTSYILQPSPQKHHIASINKFSRVSRGSCSTCTGEPV